MSEYQYYEFQTIDQPLTDEERNEIGSWSSRTIPTSTQAIFTYSYGDFSRSPEKVVEKYFDAMLYVANWGTKRLIFRLPRITVDEKLLKLYCFSDSVKISTTSKHVIVDICFNDEEGSGWIEGEGWLSSLITLRNDLLNGDLRIIYLAWLNAVHLEYDIKKYNNKPEPPVPDNLQNLSAGLKSFVDFFGIDQNLLVAASAASMTQSNDVEIDFDKTINRLSEKERLDFLVRLARGEQYINLHLLKRLRELASDDRKPLTHNKQQRKIGELLRSAEKLSELKKEQQRKKAEQARLRRLKKLAKQESELWEKVFQLIDRKQAKAYDEAIDILLQLRELAEHLKEVNRFESMLDKIHQDYSRLSGLKARLTRVGLTRGAEG